MIKGHKLWIFINPEYSKKVVKGNKYINENEDNEAIFYFMNIFPRIIKNNEIKSDDYYIFVQ